MATQSLPAGKYRLVSGTWYAATDAEVESGAKLRLIDTYDRVTIATIGEHFKTQRDGLKLYTFTTPKLTSAERTAKRAETLRLKAERANSPEGLKRAMETAERIDARLAAKATAKANAADELDDADYAAFLAQRRAAAVTPSAPAPDPTGVLAGLDPTVLAALLALVTPAASAPAAIVAPPAKPRKPRAKSPAPVKSPAVECAACGKPRVGIHVGCKLPACAACMTADTDTVVKRAMRRANEA